MGLCTEKGVFMQMIALATLDTFRYVRRPLSNSISQSVPFCLVEVQADQQ